MSRYWTVVADPPWPYPEGFNGWGNRRVLPYAHMTVDDICALPVEDLIEREGYLFLWVTGKYMEDGYRVVRAWGCVPKQVLTWCKEPMGSGLGGMFASTTEHVIVAQRVGPAGKSHGRRTTGVRIPSSWFQWKRPYRSDGKPEHSAKPDGFIDMVEQVALPPYLEIFARRARFGWDYAGDGSLGTVDIPGLRSPGAEDVAA